MFSHPYTFVQRTFPPTIGCLSSPSVEQICQKNNLSFVEMLRPFCSLSEEHRLRDPSGNDHKIKNLHICIQDVNDRPPQPSLAKKLLNESVSNIPCETMRTVVVNNTTLDIPTDCKWFHSWSKTFLLVQYPSDHEFTKHLLGCLLVTSTVDPPETLQLLLQSLQQMQAVAPSKLPKWFSTNIFKYYVLVHDVKDGDREKALNFFSSLKSAYGPEHCFFLEINSQQQQQQGPSTVIHDYWIHFVLNKPQECDGSDHGSSPRTPAEINNIGGMPNTLVNESDSTIRSGSSLEIGQEPGEMQQPVVLHPLSPDLEFAPLNANAQQPTQSNEFNKVVNLDVWTGLQTGYQHGTHLTPGDIENIKDLIKNLVVHVLVPHVEKLIFQLNDLTSNKKGVSRSLLSATKRLFGTSKPGSPNSSSLNSVIYAYDAPELQLRRLGDLYFMFMHYSLAFQAYHSAKRDFAADQAYIYLAGALEMAALSAFMQGDTGRKTLDYIEEAILMYLNSCKLPQFATRTTLLSTHFLKDRQMYGEAAKQLIRMTSEDSDLRSALLLEQASYCFLHCTRPNMSRKYAFHMVLAGHRFSKAGQSKHALRCYKQAFQVYRNKGWNLAEDHIHFRIGRLAGHLKLLDEGADSLSSLLSSGSKQTPGQQVTYLREYLQMLEQLYDEKVGHEPRVLPLPIIEDNSSRVLVSGAPVANATDAAFEPDSPAEGARWSRMEELAVTESQGPPMIFRPTVYLFSKMTNNATHPVVVVGETINVQVSLKNPLQISLPLVRVGLLWNFRKADGGVVSNEAGGEALDSYIRTNVLSSVNLDPLCTQRVTLTIVPLSPGRVDILGMNYALTCPSGGVAETESPAVFGKQLFAVRGPRSRTKKDQTEVSYEEDKRLEIKIVEALPLLQVETEGFDRAMLCGEIRGLDLKLTNSGNAPLRNLYLVTSSPQLLSVAREFVAAEKVVADSASDGAFQECSCDDDSSSSSSFKEKSTSYKLLRMDLRRNGVVAAKEELTIPMWIRAPDARGETKIDVLFYYESATENVAPRYRLTRFSQTIAAHDSLQLSAVVTRSNLCEDRDIMNIALTVKNMNSAAAAAAAGGNSPVAAVTVSPIQISLATSKWQLQPKAIYLKDLRLMSEESYSFLVRANRSSDVGEISDICLQDDDGDVVESGSAFPYYDFYKWHARDDKDDNFENLYKMALCLRWRAEVNRPDESKKWVVGQSHVTLTELSVPSVWPPDARAANASPRGQVETVKIFGPERRANPGKTSARKVRLENALSYNLLHERNVEHSFERRRICRVEVRLVLRNCIDFPLRVAINAPGTKCARPVVSRTQLYTPHSSSTFNWTSRSRALVRLAGNEKCIVVLAASFTAPGTYDLGSRLAVAAATDDGDASFTAQLCSVESSVIILERKSGIDDEE